MRLKKVVYHIWQAVYLNLLAVAGGLIDHSV